MLRGIWRRNSILWVWLKGLGTAAAIIAGAALVFLVVSAVALGSGGREIVMPNVEGLAVEEARQILAQDNLMAEVISRNYHDSIPEGHVVATVPVGGTRVRTGRKVKLTVSRGAWETRVPVLVGKSLGEAIKSLKDNQLVLGNMSHQRSDRPEGEILAQSPLGGQSIARGQAVSVTISGGPNYGMVVSEDGRKILFRTVKTVVPAGEAFQQVEIRLHDESGTRTIYDQIHQPGEEIAVDFQAYPGTQVTIYIEDQLVFERRL